VSSTADVAYGVPKIPASAGAMVFDRSGRLLILKPSYKPKWTIPGGQVEPGGESPWDACRREAFEECGLHVEHGRLVCVDFLRPRPDPHRPGGVRFLFNCGVFEDDELRTIKLQEDEILEYRLAPLEEAFSRLSGPLRRRIRAAAGRKRCVYLEDGRRLDDVR
jgi:8-oxo-dGTP diphosphatase